MDTSIVPIKLENLPEAKPSGGLGLGLSSVLAFVGAVAAAWFAVQFEPVIAKAALGVGALALLTISGLMWSYIRTSAAADVPVSHYHRPSSDEG